MNDSIHSLIHQLPTIAPLLLTSLEHLNFGINQISFSLFQLVQFM